ncbi:hypothetical protein GGS20DRAFT_531959 [Poronia punctata]|nr:hypothetical protein GGS20DRAFT_531959 [Poronia punctata]
MGLSKVKMAMSKTICFFVPVRLVSGRRVIGRKILTVRAFDLPGLFEVYADYSLGWWYCAEDVRDQYRTEIRERTENFHDWQYNILIGAVLSK